MADPLKFQFELLDKMSGPAKTIDKAVTAATAAIKAAGPAASEMEKSTLKTALAQAKAATETHRLAKELDAYTKLLTPAKKVTLEMGNMFHSFAGFRKTTEGNWIFNLADGLKSVVGVVSDLANSLFDVTTRALQVGAATEKSGRAFRLNLGSGASKEVLDYVDFVEKNLKGLYTKEQLRGQILPLAQQGVGVKDIGHFLPAAHSIGARGGSAEAALGAFGNIKTGHTIGVGDLAALGFTDRASQVALAGKLSGQQGLANRDPGAALGILSQRIFANPALADKIVDTLLREIQRREGGKLGIGAAEAANSPSAALTRIENLPTVIAEKLSASGGFEKLYKSLDRFADAITGPDGKRFIDALSRFIDRIADLVDLVSPGGKNIGSTPSERAATESKFKVGEIHQVGDSVTRWNGAEWERVSGGSVTRTRGGGPRATFERLLGGGGDTAEPYKDLGGGGVIAPTEAQQFGYNAELGAIQARGGNVPFAPQAHDMIWRGDSAVQLDPKDTLMAFKPGGSLGIGGGGSGMSVVFQFGDVNVNGGSSSEQASAFLNEIREQAPAHLLLSALEQFRAEQGA